MSSDEGLHAIANALAVVMSQANGGGLSQATPDITLDEKTGATFQLNTPFGPMQVNVSRPVLD